MKQRNTTQQTGSTYDVIAEAELIIRITEMKMRLLKRINDSKRLRKE